MASMTVEKQQALALRQTRAVVNRHLSMIATEYRKAIRAAKTGQPGDPAFMREQFRTDLTRDVVQIACATAGIPVPDGQV